MREGAAMRAEYDFSNAKKNPYAKKLKKQITINLDISTIDYFKDKAETSGIPYQTLINLYLADCAQQNKDVSSGADNNATRRKQQKAESPQAPGFFCIIELLLRKKLLQALFGKQLLCRGPWVIGALACIQCDPGGTVLPAAVRDAICAVQDGGHIDSAYTCIDSLSVWGCYALRYSIGIQQL